MMQAPGLHSSTPYHTIPHHTTPQHHITAYHHTITPHHTNQTNHTVKMWEQGATPYPIIPHHASPHLSHQMRTAVPIAQKLCPELSSGPDSGKTRFPSDGHTISHPSRQCHTTPTTPYHTTHATPYHTKPNSIHIDAKYLIKSAMFRKYTKNGGKNGRVWMNVLRECWMTTPNHTTQHA